MKKTRILLAEDDNLVAIDLAHELETFGLEISGITSSLRGALHLIEREEVDFALLNVGLCDGESYCVARRLKELGIPFIFLTSYMKAEIRPEFRSVPVLAKPQDPKDIAKAVACHAAILSRARARGKRSSALRR